MDRNVEDARTFISSDKPCITYFKTLPIVKTYNRYKAEKHMKSILRSSWHGHSDWKQRYLENEHSSTQTGDIHFWFKKAQGQKQTLPVGTVSLSGEESETEVLSHSEESSASDRSDSDVPAASENESEYRLFSVTEYKYKTCVQQGMNSRRDVNKEGSSTGEFNTQPAEPVVRIKDDVMSKCMAEKDVRKTEVQQANTADLAEKTTEDRHKSSIPLQPPKRSLGGPDTKLYKTLLDTLQQVTCYQELYFDFSDMFPLHQFMENIFTTLMAKGYQDVAFMTQMHKFHRPLPFLQFGFVFPHDHKGKGTDTGSENMKALKEFQNELKRHNLRYGDIVSCQIHTQLVHTYLPRKKFGKALMHLSKARDLIFEAEPCEFTAWFFLTEAMYYAALLKASDNYKDKIMESLQQARDHFQLEEERGKNFSYERCLILWWMFITKTNLVVYHDVPGTSLCHLIKNLRLLETWTKLSPSDRRICRQILKQFKKEIMLLVPDIKGIKEVFSVVDFFERYCHTEPVMDHQRIRRKRQEAKAVLSGIIKANSKNQVSGVESSTDDETVPADVFYRKKAGPVFRNNGVHPSDSGLFTLSSSSNDTTEDSGNTSPCPGDAFRLDVSPHTSSVKAKRVITRGARNAKYNPQQTKTVKAANTEATEEHYTAFRRKMTSIKAPPYVLSSMLHSKAGKIYVDIKDGMTEQASSFLSKTVPKLFQFIQLTEQEPMEFIGGGSDTYSAGAEKTTPAGKTAFLARPFIQAGNQLLPVRKLDTDIKELCDTKHSLQDIMCSEDGTKLPTASSAGFVSDQRGTVYKLTVRHPFKGKERADGRWEPFPGADEERVPVVTEIYPGSKTPECGEVVYVGNEMRSAFEPYKVTEDCNKAVDIALVKLKDETLQHQCLQLHCKNGEHENIAVKVYEGSDQGLQDKEVEKTGPTTQRTSGRIVLVNQDVYIDGEPCSGTFLVKSTGKSDKFAQGGDSGSLVTERVKQQKEVLALGLCFMVGDYTDPHTGVKYKDVTRCVGLQHCFSFAKAKWKLKLQFCSLEKKSEARDKDTINTTPHTPITRANVKQLPVKGKPDFRETSESLENTQPLTPILERKSSEASDVSDNHDSGFHESVESVSNDEMGKSQDTLNREKMEEQVAPEPVVN